MKNRSKLLAGVLAALLAGCSGPADLADIHDDLAHHTQTLPSEVLSRPLTVDDAIALAMRYNLDSRVKALEASVAALEGKLAGATAAAKALEGEVATAKVRAPP